MNSRGPSSRGVRYVQQGAVLTIVLDRPAVANAFDIASVTALREALDAAEQESVRAVIIRGEGQRFCGGGDVASFAAAPPEGRAAYVRRLADLLTEELRRLRALPKPVIAAVHGAVAGAGLALLLSADVALADASTKFVFAYGAMGLTPDCGVSYLLPRAVGTQRALELALTGRVLTSKEAEEWGLVARVTPDGSASSEAEAMANAMTEGAAMALGQAKRLIRQSWEDGEVTNANDEARTIASAVMTPDANDRIDHFIRR